MVIDNVVRNQLIKDVFPEPDRARFFLKIEDGCNGECTYCIVSKVRKKIESKPFDCVGKEIRWALAHGYKELVLVGANLGLYGIDMGGKLTDLLRFLHGLPNLPRIRLSSIEPRFVTPELIAHLKDLPVCRHFHIPLQSADDRILLKMGRDYDVGYLTRTIDLITTNFEDVSIGADIIVGFPGEDDENFLSTYRFIESNPLTHLHVFSYSPRPQTAAYNLGDPVKSNAKKERLGQLKDLIHDKYYKFRRGLAGKVFEIITEVKGNIVSGLTDNYIRVYVAGGYEKNRLLAVRITEVTGDKTLGEVVDFGF